VAFLQALHGTQDRGALRPDLQHDGAACFPGGGTGGDHAGEFCLGRGVPFQRAAARVRLLTAQLIQDGSVRLAGVQHRGAACSLGSGTPGDHPGQFRLGLGVAFQFGKHVAMALVRVDRVRVAGAEQEIHLACHRPVLRFRVIEAA
jgi:hypothetical protein